MRAHKVGLFAVLTAIAMPAAAQQLRGVVRDSTAGIPIVGAVIVALDADGNALSRIIAGADGRYSLPAVRGVSRIQVLRIGFRPRTVPVAPLSPGEVRQVDVGLVSIPTFLDQVDVVAAQSQCPRRPDAIAAGNLYTQARAGLLATVVTREANPATITRIAFDRTLDANGLTPVTMSVRRETADSAIVSFNAVRSVDFTAEGFTADTGTRRVYYGPDADVLLDEKFAAAYCFHIADPDQSRPTLIGLGFTPARRRGGRVDIDGTLWIDTVARRLESTEFRYLGLDEVATGFGAGGTISYREVQPGMVLIDRWTLRLVGSSDSTAAARQGVARQYAIHEIGGELAAARWPDGREWAAPLGGLRLAATGTAGTPVPAGTVLGLVNTDYRATTDSAGHAAFSQLVPGPYTVMSVDDKLANLGLTLPTDVSFVARRDSVYASPVHVPTRDEFVSSLCRSSGRLSQESAWIIGRVGTGDGHAVPAARWRLSRSDKFGWTALADGGATGASGLFTHCRNLAVGQTVQVQAWREREAPTSVVRRLTDKLTVMPVLLPSAIVVRGGAASPLAGTVLDSAAGSTVAGAYLEVMGTRLTAISDTAGRFRIAAVPRGTYTVEVRTPALDALGTVGRTEVTHDGRTPARIYIPTMNQIVSALCGPSTPAGTGLLIGNVQLTGEGQAPEGVRLVAEWTDSVAPPGQDNVEVGRLEYRQVRADANGTFRLCGLPVNQSVVVRTEVDSGVDAAAIPHPLTIDPARRFARVDLTMEPGLHLGAAFAGVVLADSTNARLAGAEVSLPDLGLTMVTNIDGEFRMDSIPPGTHRVTIRRPGYAPMTAQVAFAANQTVDHQVVLGRRVATALGPVTVTEAPSVNESFDTNRKLGLGRFITADELEKNAGRNLSDVFLNLAGPGAILSTAAGHAGYVTARRLPPALPPRISTDISPVPTAPHNEKNPCGASQSAEASADVARCNNTMDEMRQRGIYCPENGDQRLGVGCACYAQIWVDGRLMTTQRPTEPFDINQYPPETLAGLEWYATPSQTPARYSTLNAICGVLALWTKDRPNHPQAGPTGQE